KPSILLMDEPFSSIDALTRAELQDLVLRLWEDQGLTILFITHDIDEAVYLSGKVLVLTSHPGTVADQIDIDLPRPRQQVATRELPQSHEYRRRIFEQVAHTSKARLT